VIVCEEDGEEAAGEGDEEGVDADGGVDFGAGDARGEIEADEGENGEDGGAEEEEDGPEAEGAERLDGFSGAEEREDEREHGEEWNDADAEMFHFLEAAQEPEKNPEDGVGQGTGEKDSAEREQAQARVGPDGIDSLGVRNVVGNEAQMPGGIRKKYGGGLGVLFVAEEIF